MMTFLNEHRTKVLAVLTSAIIVAVAGCVRFVGETVVPTERVFDGSVESVADCIHDMPFRIRVRGDAPWWFFVRTEIREEQQPPHAPRDLTMSDLPFAWEEHQHCTGCVALVYDEVDSAPTTPMYRRRGDDLPYVAVYGISVLPGIDTSTSRVSIVPIHYAVANRMGTSPHGFDAELHYQRQAPGTHDQAVILDAVDSALRGCAEARHASPPSGTQE